MRVATEMPTERAASSTFRCVSSAATAASILRLNLVPCPLTRLLSLISSRIVLLFRYIRVMDVVTAVITAEGEIAMATSTTEEQSTGAAASLEQKPEKNANVAPQKPRVAPGNGEAGKKSTSAKKAVKAANKPAKAKGSAREGSKTAAIQI